MVDFSNDSMLAIDKKDINVLIKIEAHYNIIEALVSYRKEQIQNISPVTMASLSSRIEGLFYFLRPSLKKYKNTKEYEEIKRLSLNNNIDIKLESLELMQDFLFDKGVLMYGITKKIDTTSVLEEDESKGL